jgi:glycosyltransferase involved in cell wall biosynthesis
MIVEKTKVVNQKNMRILFVTAAPYLPQSHGGMATCADDLCRSLKIKGHRVSVLAGFIHHPSFVGWKSRIKMRINERLSQCKVSCDIFGGYPVWRSWFPWEAIDYVARKVRPDLIVIMAGNRAGGGPVSMALAAQRTTIPILMLLQDVDFDSHGARFEDLGDVPCVANSRFTAEKYRQAYGVNSTVIYPFIATRKYETKTTKENVTFVNPVQIKGLDIALGVARLCPEIPFSFVESWRLSAGPRQKLMEQLAALPNITFCPPQTDMRVVYGKCKILLAPSMWEEAYGRVATEAQMSGVPVVASARGGLPADLNGGPPSVKSPAIDAPER